MNFVKIWITRGWLLKAPCFDYEVPWSYSMKKSISNGSRRRISTGRFAASNFPYSHSDGLDGWVRLEGWLLFDSRGQKLSSPSLI